MIANFNQPGQFRVVLAKRNDFLLQNPTELKVKACKVIWRPDGKELLVVQADDCNDVRDRRPRAASTSTNPISSSSCGSPATTRRTSR